eukprot:GFYU01010162.1.p1 GENE.GFYU01010162.1~~GFYU01010162.1.p1  ORF type:complete len:301 (-),score=35.92 GFYU01010162.1:457-1359(-)
MYNLAGEGDTPEREVKIHLREHGFFKGIEKEWVWDRSKMVSKRNHSHMTPREETLLSKSLDDLLRPYNSYMRKLFWWPMTVNLLVFFALVLIALAIPNSSELVSYSVFLPVIGIIATTLNFMRIGMRRNHRLVEEIEVVMEKFMNDHKERSMSYAIEMVDMPRMAARRGVRGLQMAWTKRIRLYICIDLSKAKSVELVHREEQGYTIEEKGPHSYGQADYTDSYLYTVTEKTERDDSSESGTDDYSRKYSVEEGKLDDSRYSTFSSIDERDSSYDSAGGVGGGLNTSSVSFSTNENGHRR